MEIKFPVSVPGFAPIGEYRRPKDGDSHYLTEKGEAQCISFQATIPIIILTEVNIEYKKAIRELVLQRGWVTQTKGGEFFWSAEEPIVHSEFDTWFAKGGFKPLKPILDFYGVVVPQVPDWRTSKIEVFPPFSFFR